MRNTNTVSRLLLLLFLFVSVHGVARGASAVSNPRLHRPARLTCQGIFPPLHPHLPWNHVPPNRVLDGRSLHVERPDGQCRWPVVRATRDSSIVCGSRTAGQRNKYKSIRRGDSELRVMAVSEDETRRNPVNIPVLSTGLLHDTGAFRCCCVRGWYAAGCSCWCTCTDTFESAAAIVVFRATFAAFVVHR